ncbi:MAG: hypothetical protein ABJB66_06450 [Gemmatimonadaceae bacterium]
MAQIIAAACVVIAVSAFSGFALGSHVTIANTGLLPGSISSAEPTTDDSLFRVVIVAQRADCSSNLNQLAFLNRASISRRITERFILLAGPAKDTLGLRSLLPRGFENAQIAVLQSSQERLLRQLGHVETPTLALYDNRNRLLVLSATPPDAYQRTVFVRALTRLITGNPTP